VTPDHTVALQPVQLGNSSGDDVAVQTGLVPGDQVVIDGVDRLRTGSKVAVTALPDHHTAGSGVRDGNQVGRNVTSATISQRAEGDGPY
jgi:membrane fusion protein, multidrug efflux system